MNNYQNYQFAKKIQYRNASYEGWIHQNRRNGLGILITDQSQIFIAQWQNNKINGKYIYVDSQLKAFGQMHQNKFSNYNMIQTNDLVIYANFHSNNLNGNVIFKSSQHFRIIRYKNGQQVLDYDTVNSSKVFPLYNFKQKFQSQFGTNQSKMIDFLHQFLNQYNKNRRTLFTELILSESYRYYGFINNYNEGFGLGCVLKKDGSLYSCGMYDHTQLNGLGRMYPNSDIILDGVFRNNVLKGIGIKYSQIKNQFQIGIHQTNQNIQIEKGQPYQIIKEIRKQLHLRSTFFLDQFIVRDLIIRIKKNEKNQKIEEEEEEVKQKIEKPVNKLTKQEQQEDLISNRKRKQIVKQTSKQNMETIQHKKFSILNEQPKKPKLLPIKQKKTYEELQVANNNDPSQYDSDISKDNRSSYAKSESKKSPKAQDLSVKLVNNQRFFSRLSKKAKKLQLDLDQQNDELISIINQTKQVKQEQQAKIQNIDAKSTKIISNIEKIPNSTKSSDLKFHFKLESQQQKNIQQDKSKQKTYVFGKKRQQFNIQSQSQNVKTLNEVNSTSNFSIKVREVQFQQAPRIINRQNQFIKYKFRDEQYISTPKKNVKKPQKEIDHSKSKSKKKFDLNAIYKQFNLNSVKNTRGIFK